MSLIAPNEVLKRRLQAGERLVGTFVKTPHSAAFEVLATAGFDFLVLDAEHAPFDRAAMDTCILGALAWGCPVIVRVPAADPAWINVALDCAAAGIMLPQVSSLAQAEHAAHLVTYRKGRGFSPSPRAGEYGARGLAGHLRKAGGETMLICQIEDRPGVDAAADIAKVGGVDALFVGPADLAVSMGHAPGDTAVAALCEQVMRVAGAHCRTGMFVASASAAAPWQAMGGSVFVAGTDHAFLKAAAKDALAKDKG